MKYCLQYTNISTKLNKCDEITIKYIEDKGLVSFLTRHSAQRINLLIDATHFTKSELRKIIAIKTTYPNYNFALALDVLVFELTKNLRENNIPFYVAKPCLDWEMLNILLKEGVCAINISGPLGFELSRVRRCVGPDIQLRAIPNKVSALYPENTAALYNFFIRPEDVEIYENFIDILEFEGIEKQDIFYSIYAEQKIFIGNLNQCIYDFKGNVDNKGLIKLFGERRRDCGRQCLKGGGCRRCDSLVHLAQLKSEDIKQAMFNIIQEKEQSSEN